jgi:hypothetical protein
MWFIVLIILLGPAQDTERAEISFGKFKNLDDCIFARDFLTDPMFNKSKNLEKVQIYCKREEEEKKA